MPPMNAGVGHASGRGAPSTAQLATELRQKLARKLPDDATFQQRLEKRLNLHPFRGIVTGVVRDSSGTNKVYIQRTGQAHADPNPYPVFASKLLPINGDEVLLEYVAGSPTAMVTQARKGGRPDELDVPYSGGSRRTYDSGRALIRKHRDDHNTAHYRSDGTTVAHVTGENGDHQSIGDHYHSVGTLTESAGKSGGYQRHTRSSGRYENRRNDGSTERLAMHIEEVSGDVGFYLNNVMHVNHTASGNGGKTRHKQHGGSGFHESGDDGTGSHQMTHASGQVMWNHNNTSLIMSVFGSRVVQHSGSLVQQFVGDKVFAQHDGTTLTLNSNSGGAVLNPGITHNGVLHTLFANNRGIIQHGGSGLGGQMMVNDSSGGQHLVRESTTGHLEHISTGGEMHLKTSGATGNQHLLDGNQHQFPSTTKLQSMSNDSSRIDVLSGNGGGAIKQASHSTTTITNTATGLVHPSASTSGVAVSQALWYSGAVSGGTDTGLLFKSQYVQIYNGGNGNPAIYKTPAVANNVYANGGTPIKISSSGAEENPVQHVWQLQNIYANGGFDAYGTTLPGCGTISSWGTVVTVLVNS